MIIRSRAIAAILAISLAGSIAIPAYGAPDRAPRSSRVALAVDVGEAADLEAREALAEELRPLQDQLRKAQDASFGGMWIDSAGRGNVGIVHGAETLIEIIGNSAVPGLLIHEVKRSESELDAIMWELRREYTVYEDAIVLDGVRLAAIYVDIPGNSVVLEALSGTTVDWEPLRQRFGPGVDVRAATAANVPVACVGRSNCGSPMKAGLNLFFPNGQAACTAAFQVLNANGNYILSAGHCWGTVYNARHHPASTKIGSQQAHAESGRVDSMIIKLVATAGLSNKLFLSPTNIVSITRLEQIAGSTDVEIVGEPVCVSKGSATGNTCGTLLHNNVDINGLIEQRMASNMWVCGGDSGSPVYFSNKAIGVIHTASNSGVCGQQGSNSFYSHIYWIQDKWQAIVRTT